MVLPRRKRFDKLPKNVYGCDFCDRKEVNHRGEVASLAITFYRHEEDKNGWKHIQDY